jgi:hypothetical protein
MNLPCWKGTFTEWASNFDGWGQEDFAKLFHCSTRRIRVLCSGTLKQGTASARLTFSDRVMMLAALRELKNASK